MVEEEEEEEEEEDLLLFVQCNMHLPLPFICLCLCLCLCRSFPLNTLVKKRRMLRPRRVVQKATHAAALKGLPRCRRQRLRGLLGHRPRGHPPHA